MEYFCIPEFKSEFEKLVKKNSYRSLEQDIIQNFLGKSVNQLSNGTRLNNSSDTPFIKKRINGSGGFRFYYYLIINKERFYFLFVHPKTGPYGSENITDDSKAYLYKRVLEAIKTNDLYHVGQTTDGKQLKFTKLSNS